MDSNEIYLAGIFDQRSFIWGPDILAFTVKLINEGTNSAVVYKLADSKCDETAAAKAYWSLRTLNGGVPMDGIIGARCSGASVSLARIAGLEGVTIVSPSSASARLSDAAEFPYFSRLVAPNDERGEAAALVSVLRSFDWDQVTILSTDTTFSKDWATEFRKLWIGDHSDMSGAWKGKVSYSETIRIKTDGSIEESSVIQALESIPVDDSRIIVLLAHKEHAFPILKIANAMEFQPDTVWAGPSSWVGKVALEDDLSWLPKHPGYIGTSIYRNRKQYHRTYLEKLQEWQNNTGREVFNELPVFAAEMADSIMSLVMAIYTLPVDQRKNGTAVTSQLRDLSFEGVSGNVEFNRNGDRKDPLYSVLTTTGGGKWHGVGSTATTIGSTLIDSKSICWANRSECGGGVPSDKYPAPVQVSSELGWPGKTMIAFSVLVVVCLGFIIWRLHGGKKRIERELIAFRHSIVGMKAAKMKYYVPTLAFYFSCDIGGVEQPTTLTVGVKKPLRTKITWCWQEVPELVDQHDTNAVVVDQTDGWIKYDGDSNNYLETAFQIQEEMGTFELVHGRYVVDFDQMVQTNTTNGFYRNVKRLVEQQHESEDGSSKDIETSDITHGEPLPADIAEEPQMVLVQGDIVKLSKPPRPDGWAFGTKLFHADEAVVRELIKFAVGSSCYGDSNEANVFSDSGWFPSNVVRIPSMEDLEALRLNIGGDARAWERPAFWDDAEDPLAVVEKFVLSEKSFEYELVVKAFKESLSPSVKIVQVQRIQNIGMWESYVVKRNTVCNREVALKNVESSDKAKKRYERKWLWHGTSYDTMNKILHQGFNRSFCGENSTMHGRGVYFARDAEYSSWEMYALPDPNGDQYITACRVVVGEYCKGKVGAKIPDIRDTKTHTLYDSTVGYVSGDSLDNPSIYVTYHDAQAYPEYLIKFRSL